ncbi:hypothetical protein FHX42_002835 [Saccharopolyspora lacisalsi]|uniref:Uncharacterized protein n=1 Tax=Halosaccharopolyspora lacisalsi TaxID=1000566 RepID=A0A839DVG3_9PSEU|nr:hypothetical protein [Halosaccharopolyspora lacisalsi]MBA8825484.1 hypothetical protein [Halosaccharopolyspora lacisalsi]
MSAPGIGKQPRLAVPDFASVTRLPKPIKALVYLAMLAVLTVAVVGALLATVVIIGEVTGSLEIATIMSR